MTARTPSASASSACSKRRMVEAATPTWRLSAAQVRPCRSRSTFAAEYSDWRSNAGTTRASDRASQPARLSRAAMLFHGHDPVVGHRDDEVRATPRPGRVLRHLQDCTVATSWHQPRRSADVLAFGRRPQTLQRRTRLVRTSSTRSRAPPQPSRCLRRPDHSLRHQAHERLQITLVQRLDRCPEARHIPIVHPSIVARSKAVVNRGSLGVHRPRPPVRGRGARRQRRAGLPRPCVGGNPAGFLNAPSEAGGWMAQQRTKANEPARKGWLGAWCARRDLNPHVPKDTGT